jgi:glycosyltransferase involved in cell wall biosynthesis
MEDCLKSVISQTYCNLEIIIVNDGSTDATNDILNNYASLDNRILVIYQDNSGVSIARNIALDASKGEYICFVDQDDILSSDYVDYFYKLIKDNNAQIALTAKVHKFFGELKRIKQNNVPDFTEIWTGKETTIAMLYHNLAIGPWNKMIKRDLIIKNHIKFCTNFFSGEGFAFSIECYQYADRVAVGLKKVYYYRVDDPESGASKFNTKAIYSSLDAQIYIKSKINELTSDVLTAWRFSNWHTYCDNLNIVLGCHATKRHRELYFQIKKICKRDALIALKAPISLQQKTRGLLFFISPALAGSIINFFRIRKFNKGVS